MSVGEVFNLIKPYWHILLGILILLVCIIAVLIARKRSQRKTMAVKKQREAIVFINGRRIRRKVEEVNIQSLSLTTTREYAKGKVILLEQVPPPITIESPSGNGEHEKEVTGKRKGK